MLNIIYLLYCELDDLPYLRRKMAKYVIHGSFSDTDHEKGRKRIAIDRFSLLQETYKNSKLGASSSAAKDCIDLPEYDMPKYPQASSPNFTVLNPMNDSTNSNRRIPFQDHCPLTPVAHSNIENLLAPRCGATNFSVPEGIMFFWVFLMVKFSFNFKI
jgi:hypothetical protein